MPHFGQAGASDGYIIQVWRIISQPITGRVGSDPGRRVKRECKIWQTAHPESQSAKSGRLTRGPGFLRRVTYLATLLFGPLEISRPDTP